HRQRDAQPGENAGQCRRQDDSPQYRQWVGAAVLRAPDQPRFHRAEAEIARYHDWIEALEKGEGNLRRRTDAEDVGEHGEQADLRYWIAEEEDRLEQVGDEPPGRPGAPR